MYYICVLRSFLQRLSDILQPAIDLALEGCPIQKITANAWQQGNYFCVEDRQCSITCYHMSNCLARFLYNEQL